MKIVIRGYSGSGKSTLARAIGERCGIPVLHLDRVHWAPDWTERNGDEERRLVREFMDANDSWVIDGNYGGLYAERRQEEADRILLLLFERLPCLLRVIRRWRRNRGQTRPDMGEGCAEKLDGAFLRWVLLDGRSAKKRRTYTQIAARYPEKTVVIRGQRALDRWLREEGKGLEL